MLFAYTYVPHQMEKMQAFIDFIFYAVWCQAPAKGQYSLDLFKANRDLHEVMTAFHYDDSKGAEFFSGHVERIYGLFADLRPLQIEQLRLWYRANNDIEMVCANDPTVPVKRYADFPESLNDLRDQLASFFKGLYSHLDIAALKAKIGNIDDHYDAFVKANDEGKCPFCGISDIFGEYHSTREAYDHYFPKALYPFNSINFKNLVPACHHCNSSYKTSKDPAHLPKDPASLVAHRRKALYPYRTNAEKLEISVNLAHSDLNALTPNDINFVFGPVGIAEELATWCDVYGIKERYRAKLVGNNDGKYWITQALDEWPSKGKGVAELLADLALQADSNPVAECNFLKYAYLHGCHKAGIL